MATGLCYTQSGNVKRYEANQLGTIPQTVTVYTVGYPSTAYYTNCAYIDFELTEYTPSHHQKYDGFVEGTALYNTVASIGEDAQNVIYDLIIASYTPPDGYMLDDNGIYSYDICAYSYYCNYDIKYGNKTNTINTEPDENPYTFNYRLKYKYLMFNIQCLHPIILNGIKIDNKKTDKLYEKELYMIDLTESSKFILNETVVLDNNYTDNYKTNSFEFSFNDGTIENNYYEITNKSTYLINNVKKYQINDTSMYFKLFSGSSSNEVGFLRADGFGYEINCNKIGDNFLLPDNIKDINGNDIPNYNVKCIQIDFTLSNRNYSRDCELNVYFKNTYQ